MNCPECKSENTRLDMEHYVFLICYNCNKKFTDAPGYKNDKEYIYIENLE